MDRKFRFYDSSLVEAIKLEEPLVQEFFRLLALCHTVMTEERSEGKWYMKSVQVVHALWCGMCDIVITQNDLIYNRDVILYVFYY